MHYIWAKHKPATYIIHIWYTLQTKTQTLQKIQKNETLQANQAKYNQTKKPKLYNYTLKNHIKPFKPALYMQLTGK